MVGMVKWLMLPTQQIARSLPARRRCPESPLAKVLSASDTPLHTRLQITTL